MHHRKTSFLAQYPDIPVQEQQLPTVDLVPRSLEQPGIKDTVRPT